MQRGRYPLRILVAEHQPIARRGIGAILADAEGFEIAGEASDGEQAVAMVLGTVPDVVVIDAALPRLNGIDAARRLRTAASPTRVVLLFAPEHAPHMREAADAGAAACVRKDCACEELIAAVRGTPPAVHSARGIAPLHPRTAVLRTERSAFRVLTAREREVLQALAEGWSTREIAERLHLSRKTVETHRRRMGEKLGIASVAGLTKYALAEGLTTLEHVGLHA